MGTAKVEIAISNGKVKVGLIEQVAFEIHWEEIKKPAMPKSGGRAFKAGEQLVPGLGGLLCV